jgi:phage shock protein C
MTHDTESPVLRGGPAAVQPPAPPAEPLAPKRLLRSRRDRVFGGVCGGLGEYFGVDAVLLRIVAVALALSGGVGFLVYVIAWIAIPEEGTVDVPAASYGSPPAANPARAHVSGATIAGAALVAVGALTLLNRLVPWVDAALVWPSIVVAAGVAILLSGRRRT